MPARERECGELPSPNWSLFDRKVGQGPHNLEPWQSRWQNGLASTPGGQTPGGKRGSPDGKMISGAVARGSKIRLKTQTARYGVRIVRLEICLSIGAISTRVPNRFLSDVVSRSWTFR